MRRLRSIRLPSGLRRVARPVGVAVLGGVLAVALVGLLVVARTDIGPGTVELRSGWSPSGRTELRVPPLGVISADTHDTPLGFELQVDRIDVEETQQYFLGDRPVQRLRQEAKAELGDLLRSFAVRALLVALVVGALTGAIVPRRHWASVGAGALGGVLAVAVLLTTTWIDYRPEAFANARFEGPIERAPKLFATVRQYVDDFDTVSDRIEALSRQITDLYATSAGADDRTQEGTARLLHVSDIHLNPIGLEVTRQLAEQFEVDAIIDSGDLTTFGLPLEARFGDAIAKMPVPYFLVPGNHDSPIVRESLAATPNLTLLDGRSVTIAGVKVAGLGHPSFTASNELSFADVLADVRAQAPAARELLRRERPDVLAVHDPRQGEVALGRVPLVLAGHMHKTTERFVDGTIELGIGSTGATGLGAFTVDTDLPYEAQVLSFAGDRLVVVDRVTLKGTTGEFRIDRDVIDHTDLETAGLANWRR